MFAIMETWITVSFEILWLKMWSWKVLQKEQRKARFWHRLLDKLVENLDDHSYPEKQEFVDVKADKELRTCLSYSSNIKNYFTVQSALEVANFVMRGVLSISTHSKHSNWFDLLNKIHHWLKQITS